MAASSRNPFKVRPMRLGDLTVWQCVLLLVAAPFLFALGHAVLCIVVALIDAVFRVSDEDEE